MFNFLYTKNKKNLQKLQYISLMTVFLPRENIYFLEEWIDYHIWLGVDLFFLYDNSGSISLKHGNNINANGLNKRGYNIGSLTAQYSDPDIAYEYLKIIYKFPGRVIPIRWNPTDEQGNIMYAQQDAVKDYIKQFSNWSFWTIFTDIDEFIWINEGKSLAKILPYYENIDRICLKQRQFSSRFSLPNLLINKVLDIESFIPDGPEGTIKNIVRNDSFSGIQNIHKIQTKNKTFLKMQIEEMRINHYNADSRELLLMEKREGRSFHITGQDASLRDWYKK